jgi:hypothetical protein
MPVESMVADMDGGQKIRASARFAARTSATFIPLE